MARKLKKLAKAQKGYVGEVEDGTFMLNPDVAYTSSRGVPGGKPQYQAVIYYDPRDPEGYFSSDLERMTPELNERYGVGNWIARPLPNVALSDTYQTIADENEANSYLKQTRKKREEIRKQFGDLELDLYKRKEGLEGYNEADYDPESKEIIELQNKLRRLGKEEEELMKTLSPLTYSDQDHFYNVNKGEFKLLDDALFESKDHLNYILNEIKLAELEEQEQQYISPVDATNKYFQDIKNLSPTGDIIIMQHGTSKVGPIMYGEQERKHFGYDQTPGLTDTFAEVINETFDDASGITCYMGVCKKSDAGQRLADETNMKVNVASGNQWSGYQTNFGDTFIDRFFGTGSERPDVNYGALYGYDTYDGSGAIANKNYGGDIDYGITPNASDTFSGYSNQTAPPVEIISDADYAAQQRQDLINQSVASNQNQGVIYSKNQQNLDRLKKSNSLVALYSGLKDTYDALTDDGSKYGGSLPKLQPGGKAGLLKYGINALKYTPKKIRPDLLKLIRTNNPNLDLRGINQTFDFNPQLIGVNELNLKGIDFGNLTDYEKAVISNINQPDFQPVGNFADLAKNYSQFNVDKNFAIDAANMAVDLKEINPKFYIELLTKGKPSSFMNEIFADPRIPIFNARNPVIGNQEIDWDNRHATKLRDNFTNEFEKNLRSYGKYGFYASGVPLQGATSFQRLTSNPKNRFNNFSFKTKPYGENVSYVQEPSYQYIDINTPVADYVVNAGLMNVDPITNLATFRGRGEMANQHNFLLGRTNSPSLILSGDEGFANTSGGNTIRKNIAGISTPGRGKNVLDINAQIAPLLTEKFSLNTPFEGTFMKFPRIQTYRRKTDGSMPRKSFISDYLGREFELSDWDYKAFVEDPNMPLLERNLTREEFNLLDPFKKRQYFDEQGILFDPLESLYKKEGGALAKAQKGKIVTRLADNFFSGFNNMITKKPFLPVKQFDKFLLKNFNKGEAMFIENTLKNNPSLISNNQIDLSKLKEQSFSDLAVTNHAFQPLLNNLDARMIDGTQGFRSKWTGMESSDGADFGLYRYPDLLPSQFSYLPGGFTEFKGTRITPTNYSVSMPNLLKKPYLDSHHDGLHILDPLAMGWVRGFVDAENPGLFILKELQTDINKDPMFDFLSNKNRSELLKIKPQVEKRNDKYFSNLNDINNKINNIQQRKNEIFGLDEFADEYNALDIQQQELARLAQTGENLYPTSRRIMDNSDLNLESLIPMSRIGSKPYYRFENETLNFLQNSGFNKIVIPNATSISNIQGWNAMDGLTKSQKGTLGYYSNLQKNPQLINTGNTYDLDNYSGTIFDLQRKSYNPFKEYGGQTEGYALDDTPDDIKYKTGGQTFTIKKAQKGNAEVTFKDEYEQFENFIQEEETSWDYVKNKDSAVLKPDGKTYYKVYEDGKFYPYYHQNSNGTYESEATIGFGRKGADIFDTYKSGLSLEDAELFRKEDIDNALRKTKIFIDANYGETAYDNLPARTKFMLADYTYNLGKLSKYPKFADAIMTNNIDKALAEYIRNDEKGGSPLARNEGYLNMYLQPWINNINEEELKRQEANLKMIQELQNQTVIPADNTMIGTNPFGGFKDGGELFKAQPGTEVNLAETYKYIPSEFLNVPEGEFTFDYKNKDGNVETRTGVYNPQWFEQGFEDSDAYNALSDDEKITFANNPYINNEGDMVHPLLWNKETLEKENKKRFLHGLYQKMYTKQDDGSYILNPEYETALGDARYLTTTDVPYSEILDDGAFSSTLAADPNNTSWYRELKPEIFTDGKTTTGYTWDKDSQEFVRTSNMTYKDLVKQYKYIKNMPGMEGISKKEYKNRLQQGDIYWPQLQSPAQEAQFQEQYKSIMNPIKKEDVQLQKDFYDNAISGDLYKQKLINQGYENVDEIIDMRKDALANSKVMYDADSNSYRDEAYDDDPNLIKKILDKVTFLNDQYKDSGIDYNYKDVFFANPYYTRIGEERTEADLNYDSRKIRNEAEPNIFTDDQFQAIIQSQYGHLDVPAFRELRNKLMRGETGSRAYTSGSRQGDVVLDPRQIQGLNIDMGFEGTPAELKSQLEATLAHELGHQMGSSKYIKDFNLNDADYNYIQSKMNVSDDANSHDKSVYERKADLEALRYDMYKTIGFNYGTDVLTPEILEQYKQYIKNNPNPNLPTERMFQFFNDQDIIDINNTVAQNYEIGDDIGDPMSVKYGGSLPKAQMYNSETPSFGEIALALERQKRLYEPYGGYENFVKMDDFNRYQGYLKDGDIESANLLFPQFANMSFGDYYGQTRDNLTAAQNTQNPYLRSNLTNKDANNFEFTYKGKPYHPYSYEEVATPQFTEVMQFLDEEIKKYDGTQENSNIFQNRGDLLKYINEQFPEGSKERAYINYNKSVQDGINSMVSGYDQNLPYVPEGFDFDKDYNYENINIDFNNNNLNNPYINNLNTLPPDNTRVVTNQVNFNDIQKLNNNRSNQTFISQDNRTIGERQRAAEYTEAYKQHEERMKKGIAPNMMWLYSTAPAFQGAGGYERAVEDYNYNPINAWSPIEIAASTVLPFKGYNTVMSTPLNVVKNIPGRIKNVIKGTRGSVPSTTVRGSSINPVTGRSLTFGDLANVGWGTNAAVNTFPNAISNFQEGDITSGLANTAFGTFELTGVPSSLLRGYKTLPNAAKVFGSGNIVPTTASGLLNKYPNLKYNENIGMFNTVGNNPNLRTFTGINPQFNKSYDNIIGPSIGQLPLFKPHPFYKGPTQSQFRSILRNQ